MTNTTLLEDYLKSDGAGALSDAELDQQLFAAPVAQAPTRPAAPPQQQTSIEDTFQNAFDAFADKAERSDSIDPAVKTASHGVKVLAPLMLAVARWIDPNESHEKIEQTMGAVLNRLRGDAERVVSAYGVTPGDAPTWLVSQVSGQLMEVLISAIERNNGSVMKGHDQRYLAPLLNLAEQAGDISSSPYAYPNDPKWSLINTLMIASSEVMAEYQNFNYFHEDASVVAQYVTEFLNERVIEGTLNDLTERWGLSESERGHLGASLLRQAGRILASAWADNVVATLELIKELPVESRREAMVGGYPLTAVIEAFENNYQGVEVSAVGALRAMAPMREVMLSPSRASSPVYG
ncbi:hypothetical protein [Pseudomonas sp.]|uniref:hypothetical protein n=1 Tax=Pseudomonas sp. TaxID=306 RepID=UPI0029068787|nr:hypothetical protein [Pseudomonas sp.]MDU4254423.1 hypothetical protein [Pseudomonas sp.]